MGEEQGSRGGFGHGVGEGVGSGEWTAVDEGEGDRRRTRSVRTRWWQRNVGGGMPLNYQPTHHTNDTQLPVRAPRSIHVQVGLGRCARTHVQSGAKRHVQG